MASWSSNSKLIIHLDADAFFVSVMQIVFPYLKNKPVVTGGERGMVTALSYQAKKIGIKRGMPIWQVKKQFPQCQVVEANFSVINLFSYRMFDLIKTFGLPTEQYSIDEAFIEVNNSQDYLQIAHKLKERINQSLGLSVSIGIGFNKSLAKIASFWAKPAGLITVINKESVDYFLKKTPLIKVWGIGQKTASSLNQLGLKTAFDLVNQKETFIRFYFGKNLFEIWQELRGQKIFQLDQQPKTNYQTVVRSQSFSLTNNQDFLFSRIIYHLEEAFDFIQQHNLLVKKLKIFLKDKNFIYYETKVIFDQPIKYPLLIHSLIKKAFKKIYQPKIYYRSAGCYLTDLEKDSELQLSFFSNDLFKKEKKLDKLYLLIKNKKVGFGVYLFDKEYSKKKLTKKVLALPVINL